MTFPPSDPRRFLLESIPDRFSHLSPEDFGNFVRYLFQLDGYEVLPTVSSVDLGPHVRAKKDDTWLVIIPIPVDGQAPVDKEAIRKAIQARQLYQSNQAWVITNGSFSPEARTYAIIEDVELWDWNNLYEGICQLFFEGKSHLEYSPAPTFTREDGDEKSEMKLKAKWVPVEGVGKEWYNLEIRISNPSERNVYLYLELPVLIDHRQNQISADQWGEEDFVSGLLYAGATIKTNAMFKTARVGDRPLGGKVVVTYHEREEIPKTYHLSANLRGEACYFVTYCYGRGSREYQVMIEFRDQVLAKTIAGKIFINVYYRWSPWVVRLAFRFSFFDRMIRWVTRYIILKQFRG